MKLFSKYLKYFSISVVVIVVLLQIIWLYQTFLLTQRNYQNAVFDNFVLAVREGTHKEFENLQKKIIGKYLKQNL